MGWQIRQEVTLADQEKWFEKYEKDENDKRFIVEADSKPVGIVGLTHINPVDRNAELYILIGEDNFRNKGIGRAACEFVIDYGFSDLKMHKINLVVNSYNKPAIHLYKSLGFKEEGRVTEQIFLYNSYHDEIHMGMVNSISNAGQ